MKVTQIFCLDNKIKNKIGVRSIAFLALVLAYETEWYGIIAMDVVLYYAQMSQILQNTFEMEG